MAVGIDQVKINETSQNNVVPFKKRDTDPVRTFTLLYPRAQGVNLRKEILADGTIKGAGNASLFSFSQRTFFDLKDLHHQLAQHAVNNTALIMGEPYGVEDNKRDDNALRRHKAGDSHGPGRNRTSGFKDVERSYLVLDIDGIPTPDGHDWVDDPEAAVESVIYENLPPYFQDTSFVWLFTGSHGLGKRWTGKLDTESMRFRLFFMIDKPLSERQRKSWLRGLQQTFPQLDPAIAGSVQMIYHGRPVFPVGMDDPLEHLTISGFVGRSEDILITPAPNRLDESKVLRGGAAAIQPYSGKRSENAEEAILRLGEGEALFTHIQAAVIHLVKARPIAEGEDVEAVGLSIQEQLCALVRENSDLLKAQVADNRRRWADVQKYLEDSHRFAVWLYGVSNETDQSLEPVDEPTFPITPVSLEESDKRHIELFKDTRTNKVDDHWGWRTERQAIRDERARLKDKNKLKGPNGVFEQHWDILTGWHTRDLRSMHEERLLRPDYKKIINDPTKLKVWAAKREEWRQARLSILQDKLDKLRPMPAPSLLTTTPGAGKTTMALTGLLQEGPVGGELQPDGSVEFDTGIDQRVGFIQPRHELAVQTRDDIAQKTPATAAVVKGFERPVNDGADVTDATLERMCLRQEELKATRRVGANIRTTLCKKLVEGKVQRCKKFDTCQKNINRQEVASADTPIAMRSHLKTSKPVEFGTLDALVIDEDPTEEGIGSQNLANAAAAGIPLSKLADVHKPIRVNSTSDLEDDDSREAKEGYKIAVALWGVLEVVCEHSFNQQNEEKYLAVAPLSRNAIEEQVDCIGKWGTLYKITEQKIEQSIGYHDSERKKAESPLNPLLSLDARDRVIRNIQKKTGEHRKRSKFLRTLLEFMRARDDDGNVLLFSGNLVVVVDKVSSTDANGCKIEGSEQCVLKLARLGVSKISKSWMESGTALIMTATPAAEWIMDKIIDYPVERLPRIDVKNAPDVTLQWVRDARMSSQKLIRKRGEEAEDGRAIDNLDEHGRPMSSISKHRQDLALVVRDRHLEFGEILIVAKGEIGFEIKHQYKARGWSEEGLHIENWAVEGINKYENFKYAAVLGTRDCGDDEIRLQASAQTGDWFAPDDEESAVGGRSYGLQMADGSVETVLGMGYDNPKLQDLYEMHTVNPIVQAMHRLRPCRPKGHKRLIEVFSNVAVPAVVDEVVDWSDVVDAALESELIRRGCWQKKATVVADQCRDLFANRRGVKIFRDRRTTPEMAESLISSIYKKDCHFGGSSEVTYTTASQLMSVQPDRWPNIKACQKYLARNPVLQPEDSVEYTLHLAGRGQRPAPIYVTGTQEQDEMVEVIEEQTGKILKSLNQI